MSAIRNNRARKRWSLLARALKSSPGDEDEISTRRFDSFQLFKVTPSPGTDPWCEYVADFGVERCSVLVRRAKRSFTASDLIGFNNTGNVCVWPSEECLAFYLLRNRGICKGGRVLELGGGMSCLAGVLAAKYCGAEGVTLTDGNVTSVENVRCIVARNEARASCGVLQWAKSAEALRKVAQNRGPGCADGGPRKEGLYDVILCADCLFFDETRLDLVNSIHGLLRDDGVALVMAPRRGATFQKFVEAAVKRGFVARQTERYDGHVWSRHLDALERNLDYRPDIHFPILLQLKKQKKVPPG